MRSLSGRLARWREHATLSEFSGMWGDMGTLIPLLASLGKSGQINLTASLLFGGFHNIYSGIYFDIPICVQPMKSISSLALSNNFTMAEITGAGFFVSAVVFLLGVTRLIKVVTRLVPHAVVRGIQMGAGFVLVTKGVQEIYKSSGWAFGNWGWMDNFLMAFLAYLSIVMTYNLRRTPTALLLFIFGLSLALIRLYSSPPANAVTLAVGPQFAQPFVPAFGYRSIVVAGLGQLPLTCLNSVIAVSILADDLYPMLEHPVAPTVHIATSVGVMNMASAWFGSIPYCHGAGGLAVQHRFGARTGLSVVLLGIIKITAGLLLGNSISGLLTVFPSSILGVMMCLAGVELASPSRDAGWDVDGDKEKGRRRWTVTLVTAGCLVGFNNDGLGFIMGMVCAVGFGVVDEVERVRESGVEGWAVVRVVVRRVGEVVYRRAVGKEEGDIDGDVEGKVGVGEKVVGKERKEGAAEQERIAGRTDVEACC